MNAKSAPRRNGAGSDAAQAPAAPVVPMPMANLDGLLKQQLETLNQISCALLEGSQAMRQVQLAAAHEALLRHQACQKRLHACGSVADAVEASRDAGSADLEAASRYWTELARVSNATLVKMAGLEMDEAKADGSSSLRPGTVSSFMQPFGPWNPLADWLALNAPPLP
ncbi:MAG: phasin family protein [Paucibacter sp.]|nr:phasin family protein [Roseateles sp.]